MCGGVFLKDLQIGHRKNICEKVVGGILERPYRHVYGEDQRGPIEAPYGWHVWKESRGLYGT